MQYTFPKITHIDQVLAAIEGRDEFKVKHDVEHGYKVINYQVAFSDTFPEVVDDKTAILRECRGITFCDKTGVVLNRKFQKFFNLNERAETRHENVDWSKPHMLLEKLDGSMITFLKDKNGNIRACTKMGFTDIAKQVDEFISKNQHYIRFIEDAMPEFTCIFEWCSRKQRIVVDHPVDRLVLLAIRSNLDGAYVGYDLMSDLAKISGVEVVQPHSGEIQDGEEGYVVRFEDGHMLKVKGAWYVQLHKTLEHMHHEKDVIRLILTENLDDAKPFLPEDIALAADDFQNQILFHLKDLAQNIYWIARAAHDQYNGSKKDFALYDVPKHQEYSKFLFASYANVDDGPDFVYDMLHKYVLDQCSSQTKVNAIRHLIGKKTWNDYVTLRVEE